jgi:lactate racemase
MRAIRPRPQAGAREHVVTIDTDSAPRILFYGEDFLVEDLPVGTRVIYPKRPLAGVDNRVAAIRYALNHPCDMEPLHALLEPGMKVTIAVDDISLPLPPMRRPDIRQTILEIVCEMLADHGVDDVEIIIATSLHRRMHDHEIRRMVGDKIYNAYFPDRLYNHDACDPDGMVVLGKTRHGEIVETNKRAADSDLCIYVNVNLVPMDGGHKSMGVGLCGYESLKAHHTPATIRDSNSFMDPKASELSRSVDRIGKVVQEHIKVFHIETVLNNRTFAGPLDFLMKREDDFTEADRLKLEAMRWTLKRTPRALRREVFMRTPAAYELIACYAGATEPVHDQTLEKCYEQYAIEVEGQADIVITGIPYISPYNVNSKALNPLLVQVMALGYYYHMYRNKPLLKDGGVLIISHPCSDQFDPVHHPSYIEFFNRLLPETRDSYTLEQKYQDEFAYNPSYVEMYRRGNAYHGAHPFYMWYWGQRGRERVGRVIVVGSDNTTVPALLGWERADTLAEAIAMGRSTMGRSAQITMLHHPPILMTDMI